ncbi:MAG: TetR family transcriptional regulator [Acidimicrobiales bacterium]|nr:TetR family transcriptional regulator [Acidimicrobiales bacterium]RZV48177.1 MAG: TetR/AcrR family transcriptional regulator [Acidimicrobiales bacterium]
MTKRQLDKDLVIETAGKIADREGLDAVTLTRVAKVLGISQPALYRYVDGYDDLIRSLSLEGRQLLGERLQAAAVGVSEDDAVRAMGNAWRRAVADRPGLYAATDRSPCAGDAELEAAVDNIVETLGMALVGYGLDPEEEVHAARALRSAFHGFAHLEAGDGHPEPHDLDDTFAHIIDLLCAGIRRL